MKSNTIGGYKVEINHQAATVHNGGETVCTFHCSREYKELYTGMHRDALIEDHGVPYEAASEIAGWIEKNI